MKKFIFTVMAAFALTACQESLEDRCAREAKEYTEKKCPVQINPSTTIDSMTFDKATHTVHYHYTLSGAGDNPEVISKLNPRKILIDELKNSTSVRGYKEAGYSFAYTYYSASNKGKKLFDVLIKEKDYK